MPVVFIFSAMVSGVAGVMLLYMALTKMRKQPIDMRCVDTIAMYMFYIFIIDFSLEMLDLIHRIYEADESFSSLNFMAHTKLFFSQIVLQILIGTLIPLVLLFLTQVLHFTEIMRKRIYVLCGSLILISVLAMRWNVVIGGQLFSKSFLGYTTYKMGLVTREGLLVAIGLELLPLVFLWVLLKLLPPWPEADSDKAVAAD
jgi:predicted membrane protein